MPIMKLCAQVGCRRLVPKGVTRCDVCAGKYQTQRLERRREREPADVARRGAAAARGYDGREWRTVRDAYAAQHPWCEPCLARGVQVPVAIVHHKIEPRGDRGLLLDPKNLESNCRNCHAREHGRRGLPGYVAPGH